MMAKAQAFLDSWLAKLTSRKLMVWLTATGLTLAGHVTSEDWVIISAFILEARQLSMAFPGCEAIMIKGKILDFVIKIGRFY